MSVKNNKRRGHAAEGEAATMIANLLPAWLHMERTGLDGGHDLRGREAVGEVKAVRAGPKWLKDMLAQLDDPTKRYHIGIVRLSRGAGRPVRWLAILDFDELAAISLGAARPGASESPPYAPAGRIAARKRGAAQ